MSQAKVDKYKEEKKNRKGNLKKTKRRKKFWKIFGPILAVIILAAVGAGIYYIPQLTNQAVESSQSTDEIDMDALMQMLGSVSENDAAE
jgi:H+/Cl- antiporter ClcA